MISEYELKRMEAYHEQDIDALREAYLAFLANSRESLYDAEELKTDLDETQKELKRFEEQLSRMCSAYETWRSRAENGEGAYTPGYCYDNGEITRLSDGATCYLQGDEREELESRLESCVDEIQEDMILSDYDHVMTDADE